MPNYIFGDFINKYRPFGKPKPPYVFYTLLAIVFIIGLISFPSGYRNHNKIQPLILGSLGTIGLFAAIFFSTILEVITTILFGSLLIRAHYLNYKFNS